MCLVIRPANLSYTIDPPGAKGVAQRTIQRRTWDCQSQTLTAPSLECRNRNFIRTGTRVVDRTGNENRSHEGCPSPHYIFTTLQLRESETSVRSRQMRRHRRARPQETGLLRQAAVDPFPCPSVAPTEAGSSCVVHCNVPSARLSQHAERW